MGFYYSRKYEQMRFYTTERLSVGFVYFKSFSVSQTLREHYTQVSAGAFKVPHIEHIKDPGKVNTSFFKTT